jgi:hypothetical protein
MQLSLVFFLILLATLIYVAKRYISNETLERFANAVSVVSLIAALLVFVIPAATPKEPEATPAATAIPEPLPPLSLAIFDEYKPPMDNIILKQIPEGGEAVEAYGAGSISDPTGNTVSLIVINEGSSSRVHLRDYILIKLVSYNEITDIYNVSHAAGGGGGFYIRNFVAQLASNSPSVVKAEYLPEGHQAIDEIRSEPGFEGWQKWLPGPMAPDYFYVDPGESDVFAVEINYLSPGHYIFQLGVDYFYNSEWHTQWLNQDIEAFLPPRYEWYYEEDNGNGRRFTHFGPCFLPPDLDGDPERSNYSCVSSP